MNTQTDAVDSLLSLIIDPIFQSQYKRRSSDFLRNRIFSFGTVVGMLLRMVRSSLQIDCNFMGDLVNQEPASKQAFSQARAKLRPEAFEAMYNDGIRVHYSLAPNEGLWRGFRVIANDGSTLRLPQSDELEAKFGLYPGKDSNVEYPIMARISEFIDVASKLSISGFIGPYKTSEEEISSKQLIEVVEKMRKLGQIKMLFVYDRGYPSEEFIDQHIQLGVDLLFRLPKDFNNAVKEISKWEDSEGFIVREGWPPLRVVKIPLSTGEVELLLTTLIDKEYTLEDLSDVYQARWASMEEGYKRRKITMQQENFSGKTVIAIEQEYWATLVVENLIEMGCIPIEGYWIPGNSPKKQVNRSVVYGSMRTATFQVISGLITPEEYNRKFKKIATRGMLKVRPNRNYSRESVGKPKRHHVYRRAC
jgi:hypothetical protein